MPFKPAKICTCGRRVPPGATCQCVAARRRETDRRRPNPARRGYGHKWRVEREEFLAAHPVCIYCPNPATLINHNPPHRGDMRAFWNRRTWEPCCKPCHDGPVQAREKAAQ